MSFCHPPTFPDSAGSPSAVSQAPPSMSRLLQPPPLPPGAGGAPGLRTRPRRPLACWSAAARRSPRTAAPSRLQEGHKEESGPHRHHAPARPGPGGTWLVPACEVALGAARPRRPLSHARPGPRRAAMTAGGRLRQRPPRPGPALCPPGTPNPTEIRHEVFLPSFLGSNIFRRICIAENNAQTAGVWFSGLFSLAYSNTATATVTTSKRALN